jgi:hypothetical protein
VNPFEPCLAPRYFENTSDPDKAYSVNHVTEVTEQYFEKGASVYHTHTQTQTHRHTHTNTNTHTYIVCTHTHTHTHTHTYTHTHTCAPIHIVYVSSTDMHCDNVGGMSG